jgi:DNA-directed RNA polymerase sigma subunit (sigma70/sigma32)
MKQCAKTCMMLNKSCEERECRNHLEYKEDLNCVLVAIDKNNGPLTLRQIAPRMGVSFPRIKQIQDQAMKKVRKTLGNNRDNV